MKEDTKKAWDKCSKQPGMCIIIPNKNLFITDNNKCGVQEVLENADTMAKQKDI